MHVGLQAPTCSSLPHVLKSHLQHLLRHKLPLHAPTPLASRVGPQEKLLHPDPRQRLNADEALAHEWIALKGHTGPQHHLKGAQQALRQQLAQKRLTAMWHVLDIINALDEQPASRQLSPALQKHASNVSKANFGQAPGVLDRVGQSKGADPEAPPDGARDRLNSTTDRIEELQNLFSIFDTDGERCVSRSAFSALIVAAPSGMGARISRPA